MAGQRPKTATPGSYPPFDLSGSLGRDTLTGSADRDVFDFNALAASAVGGSNRDVITDFQRGLDDIDLTGIDVNAGRSGDQGFRFIGTKDFTGKEGELRSEPCARICPPGRSRTANGCIRRGAP